MGQRIIVTVVLVVARLCLETSLAAQASLGRIHSGPESVPGVEFAAATNLSDRNVKATGIVFVPESVPRAHAVIVLIERGPTTPMAAQSRFGDASWRTLSGKCACALLYVRLDTIRPIDFSTGAAVDVLRNALLGGADAVLSLLNTLAVESSHPELKSAPIVFWGWSSAASFGTTFAERYPERTIAFIRYHTHRQGLPVDMTILKNIPALLIAGGKDQPARNVDAEALWKLGRSVDAPWTFAIEPEAAHASEEAFKSTQDKLIIPWIEAVVSQRVAAPNARLRAIPVAAGVLGNNRTGAVVAYATFPDSKIDASWLPNEAVARGWRFVLGVAK